MPKIPTTDEILKKIVSKPNPKAKLPSLLRQEKAMTKQRQMEEELKSKMYVSVKNYKFNHNGTIRNEIIDPKINYLKTTFPEAEFNEDYIYIEKLTDHRVKTSSVANRLYFNAPSINEIRKSGQHNFLMKAIQEKKTYGYCLSRGDDGENKLDDNE